MSREHEGVFDEGLQAERTALAWRRTSLAMAVAAVAFGRLAAPTLGFVAGLLAAAGLVQALLVAYNASRRYRVVHRSLAEQGDLAAVQQAGLPIAALTSSGIGLGVLALGFVLGT